MAKRKNRVRGRQRANVGTGVPISKWTSGLKLDLFAVNVLDDIVDRFLDCFLPRLFQEAQSIAGKQIVDANHLEQAAQQLLPSLVSDDWPVLNRRRVYLIRKEVAGEITDSESAELAVLQGQADGRMSNVAPRPLESLWDLKRLLMSPSGRDMEEHETP